MIYFISGHRDLTLQEFNKIYVPVIEKIVNEDKKASFIVGDYEGVDKFAMDFLYRNPWLDLTICHMFNKPRHLPENYKDDLVLIGGFTTDEERDSFMTRNSDFDIAFIKDGRWESGTAQNIKRRLNMK